jgi:hypothetical protein
MFPGAPVTPENYFEKKNKKIPPYPKIQKISGAIFPGAPVTPENYSARNFRRPFEIR